LSINYELNNKFILGFLKLIDIIAPPFDTNKKIKDFICSSPNILLINYAHIGDIIISSYILPLIRVKYPNAKIGFVVGSWSKMVLDENPNVSQIHIIDHWFYNRSKINILFKFYKYFLSLYKNQKIIRKNKYDVAIELNSHFPNMIPSLKLINIPIRIGYSTGGFGGFLTHRLNSINKNSHEFHIKKKLLKFLSIQDIKNKTSISIPSLEVHMINKTFNHIFSNISNQGYNLDEYIIMHVGTGSKVREWPIKNWKLLTNKLINNGNILVFTGKGEREKKQVNEIINNQNNCINLCDLLNWDELSIIIKNAKIIVGVESMMGHLASALGTLSINIYSGIGNINRWKPLGEKSVVITNPVPCSPCHLRNGCNTMDCVRGVKYIEVYEALNSISKKKEPYKC
jgi:ADP-heptose:LPS heptosyltransferase